MIWIGSQGIFECDEPFVVLFCMKVDFGLTSQDFYQVRLTYIGLHII